MCKKNPLLGSLIVVSTIPSLVYSSHWSLQYCFVLSISITIIVRVRPHGVPHRLGDTVETLTDRRNVLLNGSYVVHRELRGNQDLQCSPSCAVLLHYASWILICTVKKKNDVRVK